MNNPDNPIWFRRKTYGWGWTPSTWQGWVITAAYLALVGFFALTIDPNASPKEFGFTFLIPAAILTFLLLRITYKHGEKPRWQWGNKNK